MTERAWRELVRARLSSLTGDGALDEDIVEELAQHLALRYGEHLGRGMPAREAEQLVRAELDDPDAMASAIRGTARDRRPAPPPPPVGGSPSMWNDLWPDIRYGTRVLLRSRGFALAAVLTLALGIGATTAIFSVVNAVLLQPVPFPALDRLTMVWQTDRNTGTVREPSSLPDLMDLRVRSRLFSAFGAFIPTEQTLTPIGGEPSRVPALLATHDLLPLLGVRPVIGRAFEAHEDVAGGPALVLISERLWARDFQRAPSVIGSTIRLNDVETQVIGVVPDEADFGIMQVLRQASYGRGFADRDLSSRVDLWISLRGDPAQLVRDTHPLLVMGRLADGATVTTAQAEMTAIMADLEQQYPSNVARGAFVEAMPDVVFASVRDTLWILLAAVGFVLLIACVNVANLLLARGASRQREVALRTAIGAPLGRLVRQFAAENLVLTLSGAVLGIAFAWAALQVLVSLAPADIPRIGQTRIDAMVLGMTALIAVVTGMVFGLVPAAQARRLDLQGALKAEESRGATAGRERGLVRSALVVSEVALSVVLVIGAGLLVRTIWSLSGVDTGFNAAGIVKAEFQLPNARYRAAGEQWPAFNGIHRFNSELVSRLRERPGIQAVSVVANHPVDPGSQNSWRVVGREAEGQDWPEIAVRRVSPGYFETVQLSPVTGRVFGDGDVAGAPFVCLINAATARRFFADQEPVGQHVRMWGQAWQVVGVVPDERIHGLAKDAPPALYLPYGQAPSFNGGQAMLVRSTLPTDQAVRAIREVTRSIDPQLAVFGVQPLAEAVDGTVAQQRFTMVLLATFAGLALVLAAIGIHGVLSYTVAQRRHELGIRMALGAPAGRVTRLVVAQGSRLVVAGVAVGLLGAVALTRVIASQLHGVAATDLVTFLAVVPVLAIVALVATWLPARRAVRIDPLEALRQ